MSKNNRTEISEQSRYLLNTIIRLSAEFSKTIKDIGVVKRTGKPIDLQREISLPYLIMIYGKILTVYRLLNGYSLEDLHPKMIGVSNDQFTGFDIVRSMYECYLQANFIIKGYTTDEEQKYIGLWWHVRAFSERALMANNREMNNLQLTNEADLITQYTGIINTSFTAIKDKDVQEFKKARGSDLPEWPKPGKLYTMAGIHTTQHRHIYKLHSLYAHCEPFAMIQVQVVASPDAVEDLEANILIHGMYVLNISLLALKCFADIFPEANNRFKETKELGELYDGAVEYFRTSIADRRNTLNNSPNGTPL